MNIDDIINAIKNSRIRITEHADEESESDGLTFDEIFFSVLSGEIIEQYPDDKPYPSFLIYSKLENSEPIYTVWGVNYHP